MLKNLQDARKNLHMKQKDVAAYLGIHTEAYQRIEYGSRIGSVATWDKLEDLFGINQRVLRENSEQKR